MERSNNQRYRRYRNTRVPITGLSRRLSTFEHRQVLQMIRSNRDSVSELKAFQNGTVGTNISSAGAVFPLSQAITNGTSNVTRDGSQILTKRLMLRTLVSNTVTTTGATVRFIVFRDTMNQGTLPTTLNVLENARTTSPYSGNQMYTQRRFKILRDWTVVVSAAAGGDNIEVSNQNIILNSLISYLATTDVNAANGKNSLFLLVIASSSTAGITYDFDYSITYIDQ